MLKTIQYYTPSTSTISNWWFGGSNRSRQKSTTKELEEDDGKDDDEQCLLKENEENVEEGKSDEDNSVRCEDGADENDHLDITGNHPLAVLTSDSEVDYRQPLGPNNKRANTSKTTTTMETADELNVMSHKHNNDEKSNSGESTKKQLSISKVEDDLTIDSFTKQQQHQFPLSSDDEYRTCNELATPTSSTTTFQQLQINFINKDEFVIINNAAGYGDETLSENDSVYKISENDGGHNYKEDDSIINTGAYDNILKSDVDFISRSSENNGDVRFLNSNLNTVFDEMRLCDNDSTIGRTASIDNNGSRLLNSNYQLDDRVRQIILEGLSETNDDDDDDLPSRRQSRRRMLTPSVLSDRQHETDNLILPTNPDDQHYHHPSCSRRRSIGFSFRDNSDNDQPGSSNITSRSDLETPNRANQSFARGNSDLYFLDNPDNVYRVRNRRRSNGLDDLDNHPCFSSTRRRSSDLHFMVNPPPEDVAQNVVIRNIQHIQEYTDSDSSYLEASSSNKNDNKNHHNKTKARKKDRGAGILSPFSLIFNKNNNNSNGLSATTTSPKRRHTSPKKRRQRSGTITAATPQITPTPTSTVNKTSERTPMLRVKTKSYGTSDDDNERTLLYSGNRARIRSIQRIRDAADMTSNDDSDAYPVVTVNTDFLSASYSQFSIQRKSFSESSMQMSCYCSLNSSWSEYTISLPSTEVGSECKESDNDDDENNVFATATTATSLSNTDDAVRHKAVSKQQEQYYMTGHHVKEIFLDDECFCCQCTIM